MRSGRGGAADAPTVFPEAAAPPPDEALVEALRAWRLDVSRARAVPAFVVMHDRTLLAIASAGPRSLDALARVHGMGPARLADFGEAILQVVAGAVDIGRRSSAE